MHTLQMSKIQRKADRFDDFGRVDAAELCQLPGVLEDISFSGCKVRFPISVMVDLDNDYTLKIRPSRKSDSSPLVLLCHPQWIRNLDVETVIGFEILRSPDTARLNAYIQLLVDEKEDYENSDNFINESSCQYI